VNTLHRYLTRQVLASLALTVLVFTFVLLLLNVLKEILMLPVGCQVTALTVLKAVGLLIPFVLVYALPMGMLTATLLVFGRFSADQELTAARASGISLLSLITPVLLLSLALCGVCAGINLYLGPLSRVAYKDLLATMRVQLAASVLQEGRFVRDIPNWIVYVGKIYVGKNDEPNLKDVKVYCLEHETNVTTWIRAPRGTYDFNPANGHLKLHLLDFSSVALVDGKWRPGIQGREWIYETNLTLTASSPESIGVTDMTFSQLQDELDSLRRRVNFPASGPQGNETPAQRPEQKNLTLPLLLQMNWRVSFSFACFSFTLIGIPLGVRIHRRETNAGFAVALGLVALYYSFILLGKALDTRPEWLPNLIVWLPNFIFQAVGAALLWRANKGI
jgi:lipopolysaccharide export system permease protein